MAKSMRGKEVDMGGLSNVNGDVVAIGNARMNARGDLLGKNGKVVKTAEDLAREYHKTVSKTVATVPLDQVLEQEVKKPIIRKNEEVTKQEPVEDENDSEKKSSPKNKK